jgi:hypothetical protein
MAMTHKATNERLVSEERMISRRYLISVLMMAVLAVAMVYIADFHWPYPGAGMVRKATTVEAFALNRPASLLWVVGPRRPDWIAWWLWDYSRFFIATVLQWLWLRVWWLQVRGKAQLAPWAVWVSVTFAVAFGVLCGVVAHGSFRYYYLNDLLSFSNWDWIRYVTIPGLVSIVADSSWALFLLVTGTTVLARESISHWKMAVPVLRSIGLILIATTLIARGSYLETFLLWATSSWLILSLLICLMRVWETFARSV